MQGTRDEITGIDKELIGAVTAVPSNLGEPTGNAYPTPGNEPNALLRLRRDCNP